MHDKSNKAKWGLVIQGPEESSGLDGSRRMKLNFDCLQNAINLALAFKNEFSEILFVSTSSTNELVIYRWEQDSFVEFCRDNLIIPKSLAGQHPNLHLLISSSYSGLRHIAKEIDIVIRLRSDVFLDLALIKKEFLARPALDSRHQIYVLFAKSYVNAFAVCDFLWCGYRDHMSFYLDTIIKSITSFGRIAHDKNFSPEKELSLHFLLDNQISQRSLDYRYLLNYIPSSFIYRYPIRSIRGFLYRCVSPSYTLITYIKVLTLKHFLFATPSVIDSLVWRGAKYRRDRFVAITPNELLPNSQAIKRLSFMDLIIWAGVGSLLFMDASKLHVKLHTLKGAFRTRISKLLSRILAHL